MNEAFINLLEQQRNAIVHAWESRLGDAALLAANQLQPDSRSPITALFDETVRLLRDQAGKPRARSASGALADCRPLADWRINLSQAVEVLLTGEVVVRSWARSYLETSDHDLLELSEQINRVFHQLLRAYTLHYCEQCRANARAGEH